jgi:hypothetical protein
MSNGAVPCHQEFLRSAKSYSLGKNAGHRVIVSPDGCLRYRSESNASNSQSIASCVDFSELLPLVPPSAIHPFELADAGPALNHTKAITVEFEGLARIGPKRAADL